MGIERDICKAHIVGVLPCRRNDLPVCEEYNEIRKFKLEKPVYPADTEISEKLLGKDAHKAAMKNAIPEFLDFNIVECEVF